MAKTTQDTQAEKQVGYELHSSRVWYRILRVVFGIAFHTFWPMRVTGRQYVPRTGAAVIVSNHLSMVDPFAIGYAANRLVCFMAKEELFRNRFIGYVIGQVGAFPVDRARPDAATLRLALTVLKDGQLLGMFPEGTRSTSGALQEFRAGAVRIAARTRTPVIPAALYNTEHALPRGKFIRPARIRVSFGPPIELTELYDRNDKGEAMERTLATLRERIQTLHDMHRV